jgi:hypothetical protein
MNVAATVGWLGPVSSATPGGGEEFLYFFGTVLVCALIWQAIQERARTRQIRQFAERINLAYVGARMPVTFPLHRSRAFGSARSLRRTVVGSNGDKELVLFDCTIGFGRGSRRRTIVAVRGQCSGLGWAQYGPDLSSEELGEWNIVYSSNRYMSIEEIEALVEVFREPARARS